MRKNLLNQTDKRETTERIDPASIDWKAVPDDVLKEVQAGNVARLVNYRK